MISKCLSSLYALVFPYYALLWVRAILVASWLAILAEEYQQPNPTNDRDKCYQVEPSALPNVVKTAHTNSDIRNKNQKAV